MFDGARSRFEFLLPILNQETVARRIIKAVRRNAVELQMPPLVYTTDIMRGLFPAWVFDKTVRAAALYLYTRSCFLRVWYRMHVARDGETD